MIQLKATASATIVGNHDAWSVASSDAGHGTRCDIELQIDVENEDGCILVMSPAGFFTADNWYASVEEAMHDAEVLFGVSKDEWVQTTTCRRS